MKRQKSLLDYTTPGSSSSSADGHKADASNSDSDEEPSQPKRRVSGHINTVQVDRAQGGTTIIINNSGGSSVNSSPTPTQLESENTSTENTVRSLWMWLNLLISNPVNLSWHISL